MNKIAQNKSQHSSGPADHLANERTFLAWIRTSIALMGLGFVIVKFGLFLQQVSFFIGEKEVMPAKGYSSVIGIIMIFLGAIVTFFSYLRFKNIEKQLSDNSFNPSIWLSMALAVSIIIGCILLIIYLLPGV